MAVKGEKNRASDAAVSREIIKRMEPNASKKTVTAEINAENSTLRCGEYVDKLYCETFHPQSVKFVMFNFKRLELFKM